MLRVDGAHRRHLNIMSCSGNVHQRSCISTVTDKPFKSIKKKKNDIVYQYPLKTTKCKIVIIGNFSFLIPNICSPYIYKEFRFCDALPWDDRRDVCWCLSAPGDISACDFSLKNIALYKFLIVNRIRRFSYI